MAVVQDPGEGAEAGADAAHCAGDGAVREHDAVPHWVSPRRCNRREAERYQRSARRLKLAVRRRSSKLKSSRMTIY